jgi:hypothetical protein
MPNIASVLAGFEALANQFIPFLLTAVSVAVGLVLMYLAIKRIYDKASARQSSMGQQESSWGAIAGQLLIGGAMLRFGASMQDISMLLFGSEIQDVRGVMAYAPLPAQAGFWKQVLEVCLLWVVMLGWAGAFTGLMLWNKGVSGGNSGQGGDYYWRGFWHLLGGAGAVNLAGMLSSFFGK